MRLDLYLINKKLYETRNKAQNAIANGQIMVNGIVCVNTHYSVKSTDEIKKSKADEYVSRGAYKLLAAVEFWKINFENKIVLDIGASTGGFSEIAIKHHAKYVYAVDVGTNQLHHSLINHPKVCNMPQTHFNNLKITSFDKPIDIIVADISFISLTKLIDKLELLFSHHYQCVFLIKPQFELSPKEVNNGKVSDSKLWKKAVDKIITYAKKHHYTIHGVIDSPITGDKKKNHEFLIYMEK